MNIESFVFNAFYENTYILYDETRQCAIIDPGCSTYEEKQMLIQYIEQNDLIPVLLLNTHCHIDHIMGNQFIHQQYNLPLGAHRGEIPVLSSGVQIAHMYQLYYEPSPDISLFYEDGDTISFGNTRLKVLFVPGHSPASIAFYHQDTSSLIGGDVLFQGSIGRTDLPGGDYDTLISSIQNKLFTLPDDVKVYSGHGMPTTIGIEKTTNPFFNH